MEHYVKRRKPIGTGSLRKRIFLMLGIQRAYPRTHAFMSVHEEGIMDVSLDHRHSCQIETALLEADRKKAMAIMMIERQRMHML